MVKVIDTQTKFNRLIKAGVLEIPVKFTSVRVICPIVIKNDLTIKTTISFEKGISAADIEPHVNITLTNIRAVTFEKLKNITIISNCVLSLTISNSKNFGVVIASKSTINLYITGKSECNFIETTRNIIATVKIHLNGSSVTKRMNMTLSTELISRIILDEKAKLLAAIIYIHQHSRSALDVTLKHSSFAAINIIGLQDFQPYAVDVSLSHQSTIQLETREIRTKIITYAQFSGDVLYINNPPFSSLVYNQLSFEILGQLADPKINLYLFHTKLNISPKFSALKQLGIIMKHGGILDISKMTSYDNLKLQLFDDVFLIKNTEKLEYVLKTPEVLVVEKKQISNSDKFLRRFGIVPKNGKIVVYKRVSKDFKTQEKTKNETTWTIGKTLSIPKNQIDLSSECGPGKFHACAVPLQCDKFRSIDKDRYIAIQVDLKYLHDYKIEAKAFPTKIRFTKGKVLYEVDIFGNKIS